MKAASYFLFVLAGAACAVVVASFLASDVRARFSAWKHGGVVASQDAAPRGTDLPAPSAPAAPAADDPRWAQLFSRLDALQAGQQALADRLARAESRLDAAESRAPATLSGAPQGPVAADVPVAPLLALKMPAAQFFPTGDRDLFGLSLFSGLRFTAYRDKDFEAKWWFFDDGYAAVKRNLAASSAFQTKETNSFFGKSSFVNVAPADGFVRVLFEASGKAVAVEVVKERYEGLKKLLLK